MRGLVAAAGVTALLGVMILVGGAGAALAKETQEFTSGQWTGFSYTDDDNGQFTDCTVWAFNRDNVQVGISVQKDYTLEFWLNSKSWNLPANQSYPVSYWVDQNGQYHGKAKVSTAKFAYVSVDQGQDVFNELKQGSQLTFRTSSDDYVFDLTGSRAALSKLLDCVDQYAKASTSNPFGGGAGGDQTNQNGNNGQDSNNGNNNDNTNNGGNNNNNNNNSDGQSGNNAALKTLTVSADDVKQFLVDVTGAKPSMITVNVRKDKGGALYYNFTTPLGGGEFWQEQLGNGKLQDVALSYLQDYKSECKGDFESSPNDPEQGQHGNLATGTAVCSQSPYQDNGPEFLSYSMSEADGVISIYLTYIGGNGAKAKTDALGKLIARRSEEQIK